MNIVLPYVFNIFTFLEAQIFIVLSAVDELKLEKRILYRHRIHSKKKLDNIAIVRAEHLPLNLSCVMPPGVTSLAIETFID